MSAVAQRSSRDRRGIALLLVLAMIILIVPIAAGLAQRSVLFHLDQQCSRHERIAQSLRRQVEEGPLATWLVKHSVQTVLGLDAITPQVEVFMESWELDRVNYQLSVTAWDQCGMAPVKSLYSGSTLRSAVPTEVLRRLPRIATSGQISDPVGLDQFIKASPDDRSPPLSVFPRATGEDVHALGAWIATHPVGSIGSINVNTAPLPLLESAMQMAGRGGIEMIIAARREGRRVPLPAAVNSPKGSGTSTNQAPRFVSASSSWSFRIDVRVGAIERSWWVVYQLNSGRWECVQRLVIPD